jgi:23S rRNA-/tRNA-specific pseudouridylate synthase
VPPFVVVVDAPPCLMVLRAFLGRQIIVTTTMLASILLLPIRNRGGCSGWTHAPLSRLARPLSGARRGWRSASGGDGAFRTAKTSTARKKVMVSGRPASSSFSTLASDGDSKSRPVGSASEENSDPPNAPPTNRWTAMGFEHSLTEFATHVVVEQDEPMLLADLVDQVLDGVVRKQQTMETASSAATTADGAFLVKLGSVWHLPHGGPARPELGGKPVRVSKPDFVVRKGDYVRIHHNPRRFRDVHMYDWAKACVTSSPSNDDKDNDRPGIVVAENATAGFLVINKPMRVPVHMTVDNCRENVQWCVKEARRRRQQQQQQQRRSNIARRTRSNGGVEAGTDGDEMDDGDNADDVLDGCYVSTPQRLDQNTSGLLVVATSKAFANYFAGLLRHKTRRHVAEEPVAPGDPSMTQSEDRVESTSVHKLYRWYDSLVPARFISRCAYQRAVSHFASLLFAQSRLPFSRLGSSSRDKCYTRIVAPACWRLVVGPGCGRVVATARFIGTNNETLFGAQHPVPQTFRARGPCRGGIRSGIVARMPPPNPKGGARVHAAGKPSGPSPRRGAVANEPLLSGRKR